MKLPVTKVTCDNCGRPDPKSRPLEKKTGVAPMYNFCCGFGKPMRFRLHLQWPFRWPLKWERE